MATFINRAEELAAIEKAYRRSGAQFLVLYGRRRVGKTTLIQAFLKGRRTIYFVADKQAEPELRRRFQAALAAALEDPRLERLEFSSWDDLFSYWLEHENFSRKVVLVLDEFQYLAHVNPAFPSILQRLWDERLRHKNLLLILCGSLIHMMYSTTLGYQSPLYGRRTGQMRVEPIPFAYYKEFFPDLSPEKRLEFFAVTGGVPRYIELFHPRKSLWTNIDQTILSKNGYLSAEPIFILSQEISEPIHYVSILKAIAEGERKIGNIASRLGLKTTTLTKYLDVLINLGLLEREVPVTEANPQKSKLGLYSLKDDFFRFWFRYVLPHRSFLEMDQRAFVLSKIRKDFPTFTGPAYEAVCRAAMPRLARTKNLPFIPDRVGRWWTRSSEIDIVAFKESTREILFAECKWTDRPVDLSTLRDLQAKTLLVPWHLSDRKPYYAIFCKKRVSPGLKALARKKQVILITGVPELA